MRGEGARGEDVLDEVFDDSIHGINYNMAAIVQLLDYLTHVLSGRWVWFSLGGAGPGRGWLDTRLVLCTYQTRICLFFLRGEVVCFACLSASSNKQLC